MSGSSGDQVTETIWSSWSWEYLRIAHGSLACLNLSDGSRPHGEGIRDILVCCVFSFLAVESHINYYWLQFRDAVKSGSCTVRCPKCWKSISAPCKWRREYPHSRMDLLARSVAGRHFFELPAHQGPRDLFLDWVDLRHALVHSTPDITVHTKEIERRERIARGQFYVARPISLKPAPPEERQRHKGLSCRLSDWQNLSDLRPLHALEVYKVALAITYRANDLFCVLPCPFRAAESASGIVEIGDAYAKLAGTDFDDVLKGAWGIGRVNPAE